MRDLLRTEVVIAALLVSSFTMVGVVALWAARSPRHWFLRASVVVAFLSPLLLIPAYELFLIFVLQAGVVVAGAHLRPSWFVATGSIMPASSTTGREIAKRSASLQFSLVSLLCLMAFAAVAVVIGAHVIRNLPPQNTEAWITIALNGLAGGAAVLLGAWLVAANRKLLAVPAAIITSFLLGLLLIWQDWLVISILQQQGWPPSSTAWQQLQQWMEGLRYYFFRSAAVNVSTIVFTTLAIGLIGWLWVRGAAPAAVGDAMESPRRRTPGQWAARAAGAALVLIAGIFPAAVALELLNPLPIARVELPNPNGYDDFVAAGKAIQSGSPMLDTMVEPKSTDELAAEIAKFKPAFDRIRLGLSRPSQVKVWPADGNFAGNQNVAPFADIQAIRSVARALSREAELAQQQGRFADAAAIAIENMRSSQACARGGLLINWLVAVAMEGVGQYSLYPTIEHLDAESCREIVAALEDIEAAREPLDDIQRRDQIWDENAYGWHGHLQVILQKLSDSYAANHENVRQDVFPKTQAINRLMIIELALRQYHLATGVWPETLNELAPNFISEVPIDPYDPKGGALRYSRTADGYLLYSVGYDGDDDGGRPPVNQAESGTYIDWRVDGDLPLDAYFAYLIALNTEAEAITEEGESEESLPNVVE